MLSIHGEDSSVKLGSLSLEIEDQVPAFKSIRHPLHISLIGFFLR